MSLIRRALERRNFSGPWGPYSDGRIPPPAWDAGGGGLPVNESTALQLIDVYACVSLWADSIAMLPVDQYRNTTDPDRPDTEVRKRVTPSKIVAQPDPEIERWDWWNRMVTSLALRGNAYSVHLDFDGAGFPTATRAVHPDDITKYRDRTDNRIRYRLRNGTVLEAWQVMHVPLVTTAGSLVGLSPIECARRGIRMSTATEQFGEKFFADGATPSSALETDKDMEDDQAKRTLARWVASHGGRRRPALLTGGLKWRAITIAPDESQFIESRQLNTSQIARMWRVPPHMIGDTERSTSWGTGIEEQGIGYVVYTLGPPLVRLEAAFNRITPRGQYIKHNVGALLRGNHKDRYASYAVARQWGWLSVNDIRALEDLPPIEGGDVYLQPMNMIDAEKALAMLLTKSAGDNGGANAA